MRSPSNRGAALRANAVRTTVFVVVTALLATLVALTLGKFRIQDDSAYEALFTNVSGLEPGAEVRAAGVVVGRVEDTRLVARERVAVDFSVAAHVALTNRTQAHVRYLNLTGDRYLEMTSPSGGTGQPMPVGGTIPPARTGPAMDLDALFNGFRPLTRAMSPDQLNQLTGSLIAVSQGQGAALESLLADVGSFTSELGHRDRLIGSVVRRLNRVLGNLDRHDGDIAALIDGLRGLSRGLARDRHAIGAALPRLDRLAEKGTGFLRDTRPSVRRSVAEARHVARVFNKHSAYADRYLGLMPAAIRAIGRAGAYGSFFNFYLCGVRFKVTGPDGKPTFTEFQLAKEERCQF